MDDPQFGQCCKPILEGSNVMLELWTLRCILMQGQTKLSYRMKLKS